MLTSGLSLALNAHFMAHFLPLTKIPTSVPNAHFRAQVSSIGQNSYFGIWCSLQGSVCYLMLALGSKGLGWLPLPPLVLGLPWNGPLKTFHILLRASLQALQNHPPSPPPYNLPWSAELKLSALKKRHILTALQQNRFFGIFDCEQSYCSPRNHFFLLKPLIRKEVICKQISLWRSRITFLYFSLIFFCLYSLFSAKFHPFSSHF